jgi:hypothetical protein
MARSYECLVCKTRVKPEQRRPVPDKSKKLLQKIMTISPSDGDVLCNACRTRLYRSRPAGDKNTDKVPVSVTQPSTSQLISPPSVG